MYDHKNTGYETHMFSERFKPFLSVLEYIFRKHHFKSTQLTYISTGDPMTHMEHLLSGSLFCLAEGVIVP
jgi:hypothetical protein